MRSNPIVTKVVLGGAVLALSTLHVGCGKGGLKSIVKDAKVKVTQVNGENFAEATVLLGTGNVLLPSFNYNIRHPRRADEILGVATMRPAAGGTEVQVVINIQRAIGTELVDPRLPNGNPLPIGGIGNAVVVGIPAGDAVKVFMGVGEKFALLGVTANIKQLDSLGRNGVPDVFIPLSTGNLMTTAGFYFAQTESKSGVGVFVDMSQILFSQNAMLMAATLETSTLKKVQPTYVKSPISRGKERELLDFLGRANSKRSRFQLAK